MAIALDPSSLEEPASPVKAEQLSSQQLLPSVTITTASASPSGPSTTSAPFAGSPLKRKLSIDEQDTRPRLEEFELDADPFLNVESNAFKAAKSARQWNGLLRWARRSRGPQWDWGTAQYHIDTSSPEYYAGVTRVAASALPAHVVPSAATSTTDSAPGTPSQSRDVGVYDSGRPRRTRAGR